MYVDEYEGPQVENSAKDMLKVLAARMSHAINAGDLDLAYNYANAIFHIIYAVEKGLNTIGADYEKANEALKKGAGDGKKEND